MDTPKKFIIIFAKDETGADTKFRFIVSVTKPFSTNEGALVKALAGMRGVDRLEPMGKYTLDIMLGRAFNPDEVMVEIEKMLDSFLSDIITPILVV